MISSSLIEGYGSLRSGWLLGGSDEAAGADNGEALGILYPNCFGSAFKVRVRAMEVPEIVAAGKFRFGVLRLFELGGLRKLDKNIFVIKMDQIRGMVFRRLC